MCRIRKWALCIEKENLAYLCESDLEVVFQTLSFRGRMMVFDVVTTPHYWNMYINGNGEGRFEDPFMARREKKWYFEMISKYWIFVAHVPSGTWGEKKSERVFQAKGKVQGEACSIWKSKNLL